ncbi:MAG: DUF4253 domain-containing protein, partial [Gemmataceae bacterium]|nr:DUF4253 domain-containing protein [Gemmataceae bacterium]
AARENNVAKLKEFLASGMAVDVRDADRMTPLMRAAEAGHAETFHLLVEAGADLNAVALVQIDVLERAACGGNVDIVRFLLQKGLPIEGHWKPTSKFAERDGHLKPLLCAAVSGHPEVVRVLLEAGADRHAKHAGETALQVAKGSIRLAQFDGDSEREQRYRAVVALLDDQPAKGKTEAPAEDTAALEVAQFAEHARQPGYEQVRRRLAERCGEPRRWQPVPDHGIAAAEVYRFTLRDGDEEELDHLWAEVSRSGYHLVLAEPWVPGAEADLLLLPTNNKYAVIAAVGTEGWNYGLHTPDIIAWLQDLEKDNPFALRSCGHDLVGGAFLRPVTDAKKLAGRMAEFCPNCLGEDCETPAELARALTKTKTFLLRWD